MLKTLSKTIPITFALLAALGCGAPRNTGGGGGGGGGGQQPPDSDVAARRLFAARRGAELFVVTADETLDALSALTPPLPLSANDHEIRAVAASADGKRIVVHTREKNGPRDVLRRFASVDGGAWRELSGKLDAYAPDLAALRLDDGARRRWVTVDGATLSDEPASGSVSDVISFLPDGERFIESRDGGYYVAKLDGSRQVIDGVLPSSRRIDIAFADRLHIVGYGTKRDERYWIDLAGKRLETTPASFSHILPDYAFDGGTLSKIGDSGFVPLLSLRAAPRRVFAAAKDGPALTERSFGVYSACSDNATCSDIDVPDSDKPGAPAPLVASTVVLDARVSPDGQGLALLLTTFGYEVTGQFYMQPHDAALDVVSFDRDGALALTRLRSDVALSDLSTSSARVLASGRALFIEGGKLWRLADDGKSVTALATPFELIDVAVTLP